MNQKKQVFKIIKTSIFVCNKSTNWILNKYSLHIKACHMKEQLCVFVSFFKNRSQLFDVIIFPFNTLNIDNVME